MSNAFGDSVTFPISKDAHKILNQLKTKNVFNELRHGWQLGAALGISSGEMHTSGRRSTFQNVNSLDPEGVFASIMVGLYPDLSPKERGVRLVDHAEWGIRVLQRKERNGTLDFSVLGKK